MSTPSEDIFNYLKASVYTQKYLDKFTLSVDPRNLLANVTPLDDADFFPTKVCHIICLTGPYESIDSAAQDASVARIQETFDLFAVYQVHFIVDKDAAGSANMAVTETSINDILTELEDYGVQYWGQLNATALRAKVQEILDAFYGS